MIDQTKDKKDDVLAQKLDAKKQDADQAQKLAREEQERAELAKLQSAEQQKVKEQPGNNSANAMQPIGSAKITAEKAEAHTEPASKGSVVGSFAANQKIDILEQKGGELKVLVDGKIGYIAASQTDFEGKEADKKVQNPAGAASVACSALYIRRAPGKDAETLGTLRQGDRVNFYAEKDGYLEVHVGDQIGWIKADYTDFAAKDKGNNVKPLEGDALELASDELKELLAKEDLTAGEIAVARDLIAKSPNNIRPALYEALQSKPAIMRENKETVKPTSPTEYANLAASLQMLGVQNPSSEMSFAAYLAQLKRDQRLPETGGMANWGSLANAMGVNYGVLCQTGDSASDQREFWSKTAREQLQLGHSVMACVNNQAVRIEAVEDEGLVISVPEIDNGEVTKLGCWKNYSGKAAIKGHGKRGIISYDALRDAGMDWVISLG